MRSSPFSPWVISQLTQILDPGRGVVESIAVVGLPADHSIRAGHAVSDEPCCRLATLSFNDP